MEYKFNISSKAQVDNNPRIHVLMPAYNANKYVIFSIESVLSQTYHNVGLLILNDGSTDDTYEKIENYLTNKPLEKYKIFLKNNNKNEGIAHSRKILIKWSKALNKDAYILWLDADDKYIENNFISSVVKQMQKTQADICLFNFDILYEDEELKSKAIGLVKEKNTCETILHKINMASNQTVNPLNLDNPNVLEFTSLGWTKCYASTVDFPATEDCPFEDFVYMSILLHVEKITALPYNYKPLAYLRRSDSICGKRYSDNFTNDIPKQLTKFFSVVVNDSEHDQNQYKKLTLAQDFVLRKLNQYYRILCKLVTEPTVGQSGINLTTLNLYKIKISEIDSHINEIIDKDQKQPSTYFMLSK